MIEKKTYIFALFSSICIASLQTMLKSGRFANSHNICRRRLFQNHQFFKSTTVYFPLWNRNFFKYTYFENDFYFGLKLNALTKSLNINALKAIINLNSLNEGAIIMRENKVSAFENLNNYHHHFLIFQRKRLHFIFKTNFHVMFNDHF